MNKSIYIISIALLFLASCDKVKKSKKRIEGQWEIISYRTTNSSGLTHYYETTGTITFGDDTDSSFTYAEDYTFEGSSGPVIRQRTGIGTFKNGSAFNHRLELFTPSILTMNECTFKLITRDDLKIEQRDSQFTHTIVLKND